MKIGNNSALLDGFISYRPNADKDLLEEMPVVTLLMPCLNEAETISECILKARKAIAANGFTCEILIADNGSTDGSQKIAKSLGARVVQVQKRGYGEALRVGMEQARGKYIIMGDADDSYDFSTIAPFVLKLQEGWDLVMGNRFEGGIEKDAMPFLHRYLGNPVLSFIGRLFFKIPVGDFHCGLRGVNREAMLGIGLQTTGMEFASEMVVKSSLNNLKITEVPTKLHPDGRSRPPHLRTWSDGWRHLRFLLLYSPKWLFLYPGLTLMILGILLTSSLFLGPVQVGTVSFDIHTMLYTAMLVVIGFQVVTFYYFARIFAIRTGLDPHHQWLEKFNRVFTLEKGLGAGAFIMLIGFVLAFYSLGLWNKASFSNLDPTRIFRWVIPSVLFLILGFQTIFQSLFASILFLPTKKPDNAPGKRAYHL